MNYIKKILTSLILGVIIIGCNSKTMEYNHLPDTKTWTLLEEGEKIGRYYRQKEAIFFEAKADYQLPNVDIGSFESNNAFPDYARDKTTIFYLGNPLEVDYVSFELIGPSHHKDKNNVYLGGHQLTDADPNSFELINKSDDSFWSFYSKDAFNVYYQWNKIEGADPSSFEVIDEINGYSKDRNSVFMRHQKVPEASPNSFVVHDATKNYYKDKNNVYWNGKKLQGANPQTFKLLDESYFSTDEIHVYFYEKKLEKADPNSFKRLESTYSKDENYVFYQEKQIEGADPESFEIIDLFSFISKDKNGIYRYEKREE